MPEPLESEPTGVTLESDALPQEDFRPGDVRRRPEAPGNFYLGQAAAVPTSGQPQVASEDPSIHFEFEPGSGEALQPPAPSCPQTAPTATADDVVGVLLQQMEGYTVSICWTWPLQSCRPSPFTAICWLLLLRSSFVTLNS
jgi:hypothetical protein